ncbi:MAG: hypothetical protein ACF8Q5_03155 [Phycisphaerales bacterium JB040]
MLRDHDVPHAEFASSASAAQECFDRVRSEPRSAEWVAAGS